MVFAAVSVQVRGTVKLLPAEETFVHFYVAVDHSMTVQVVSSIETLATNLAEKLFVFGVRVRENVSLVMVLSIEAMSAHLTGNRDVFTLSCCLHRTVSHHFYRFGFRSLPLDKDQTLLVDGISVQHTTHESVLGNGTRKLQHIVVLASVNGHLKLQKVLGF